MVSPAPSLAATMFYTSIQRTLLSTYHVPDILLDVGSFGVKKKITVPSTEGLTDKENNLFNRVLIMPFFFNISQSNHSVLQLSAVWSNFSDHSYFVPTAGSFFSINSSNVGVLPYSVFCLPLSLLSIFSQRDLICSILVINSGTPN